MPGGDSTDKGTGADPHVMRSAAQNRTSDALTSRRGKDARWASQLLPAMQAHPPHRNRERNRQESKPEPPRADLADVLPWVDLFGAAACPGSAPRRSIVRSSDRSLKTKSPRVSSFFTRTSLEEAGSRNNHPAVHGRSYGFGCRAALCTAAPYFRPAVQGSTFGKPEKP